MPPVECVCRLIQAKQPFIKSRGTIAALRAAINTLFVPSTPMRKLIAAALLCLGCNALHAQNQDHTDTSINAAYNKKIAASGDLYYGIEHLGYQQQMNGTPYFENSEWHKGSVTYNNVLYKDLQLKYDMLTDQLIVLHPNNIFAVTLVSERVQSFTLDHHEFVYVPPSNKAGFRQSGFYQLMVAGKLSVLARRVKSIEEKTSVNGIERNVVLKEQFYAVKDGVAYPVSGEESVMSLLGELARQVRIQLRTREIKFRKHKELALIEIATYYNQLAK